MNKYTARKYRASQTLLISGLSCGTEIELEMVVDYAVTPEEPMTRDHPGAPSMVEDVEISFAGNHAGWVYPTWMENALSESSSFRYWLLSEAIDQDEIAAGMAADAKFEAARDDWERW